MAIRLQIYSVSRVFMAVLLFQAVQFAWATGILKNKCILCPLDLSSLSYLIIFYAYFPVPLAGQNGSSVPFKSRHFSSRDTRRAPLTLLWIPEKAECRAMRHHCVTRVTTSQEFAAVCSSMCWYVMSSHNGRSTTMHKVSEALLKVLILFHLQHRRAGRLFWNHLWHRENLALLVLLLEVLGLDYLNFSCSHENSKEKSR